MKVVLVDSLSEEVTLRAGLVVWAGAEPGSLEDEVVAGTWSPPEEGGTLLSADGSRQAWKAVAADEDGWLRSEDLGGGWGSAGGYAYFRVDARRAQPVLLHALGPGRAYVNGEPRVGDHCWSGNADRFGYVRLPVVLRPGPNHLLFHCESEELTVRLAPAKNHAMLNVGDATLPDLIAGEKARTWGAVVVINPLPMPLHDLTICATCPEGPRAETAVPAIPALSIRKVAFVIKRPPVVGSHSCPLKLELVGDGGGVTRVLDSAVVTIRVRSASETHKRTFVSQIDGSLQYYAVNPPDPSPESGVRPALILALHGASVEAIDFAGSYGSKAWCYIVAPTGRRPVGSDWEDWGRLDALEVLEAARQELRTDPRCTYLTGHSMGGHGTWHIAQTFPDRFAAIGPSAGWLTRWSYAGEPKPEGSTPLERLLERGRNSEDTMALAPNLASQGVYILHGDADDNVPVSQSRVIGERLDRFHNDFIYHEHAGAGHWWTESAPPGIDCVDWPPLFDFFRHRRLPAREDVTRVDFITANPGVSAWCHWVAVEAQLRPLEYSSVRLRGDPARRLFVGRTNNVARLALDLGHLVPGGPLAVELDGQEIPAIPWPAGRPRLWFTCLDGSWSVSPEPSPSLKGPRRYGPLKLAFLNRPVLVYGTAGTPEEDIWAFSKARYDGEVLWYWSNASIDVLPDVELDLSSDRDRNIILYGHARSNRAWEALLADSPVQVEPGLVQIADRELRGDDLACLFLRPRPDSDVASVAVIGGTCVLGMRLTRRRAYLTAGAPPCPDCLVMTPDGVRAAGYFGMDWEVGSGEFAWWDGPT